eukprot:885021_1
MNCASASGSSSSSSSSSSTSIQMSNANNDIIDTIDTGYLNAKDAYELDQQLFSTGYTLEQLMELAGLAVAEAVYDVSPPVQVPLFPTASASVSVSNAKERVLIVCGPGNNGGDGLVAARHLVMFGYEVVVVYPKRSSREEHYSKLVKQCEDVGVVVLDSLPKEDENIDEDNGNGNGNGNSMMAYAVIVDAIFGFSFKGEAREPFGSIIRKMIEMQQGQQIPIIAVDVPSGWNVDEGDVANTGMVPDVLVSLTAPKLCSKEFKGRHYVGGRFLPPNIAEKYGIQMPPYPGVQQVMEITKRSQSQSNRNVSSNDNDNSNCNRNSISSQNVTKNDLDDEDDWAMQYASYCADKESEELQSHEKKSSIKGGQGKEEADKGKRGLGTDVKEDEDDWALQYQNYCIEKEAKIKEKEDAEQEAKKREREDSIDDDKDDDNWELQYQNYCIEKEEKLKEQDERK